MCDGVGSYNWAFDSRAINNTNRKLNHEGILDSFGITPFCIQDMYVRKVINRDYFTFIDSLDDNEKSNYLSKSGKNPACDFCLWILREESCSNKLFFKEKF